MKKLAVFGGESAVSNTHPHFVWPLIENEEKEAVMLNDPPKMVGRSTEQSFNI